MPTITLYNSDSEHNSDEEEEFWSTCESETESIDEFHNRFHHNVDTELVSDFFRKFLAATAAQIKCYRARDHTYHQNLAFWEIDAEEQVPKFLFPQFCKTWQKKLPKCIAPTIKILIDRIKIVDEFKKFRIYSAAQIRSLTIKQNEFRADTACCVMCGNKNKGVFF